MSLGSGDMRNVLLTAPKLTEGYKELNIHLIDDFNIVTARNVVMAHIMLADDFDPSKTIVTSIICGMFGRKRKNGK